MCEMEPVCEHTTRCGIVCFDHCSSTLKSASVGGLYEVVLHGKQGCTRASRDTNLVVHVAHMVVDGDLRDDQDAANLLVRFAPRHQAQHLHLTVAQTGGPARSRPA